MNLLTCVTSYNRPYYLRNMVESLKEFFPYGDMIVIDDQSDNLQTQNYLKQLQNKGIKVFITTVDKSSLLFKGGLYLAMDIAMQYAIENGYKYINYAQDDMQCMWYDENFEETTERLFASSDKVLSVCSEFYKKITSYRLMQNITYFSDLNAYDRKPLALPAVSIVSIERFKKLDFKFGIYGSEGEYNAPLYEQGFYSLTPKNPLFSWIPWPKTTTFGVTTGSEKPPKKKYYYQPISGKKLGHFLNRDLKNIPFADDYCQTWGYLSIKPYWFTQYSSQYFQMLKRNFLSRIFLFPHL